MDVNFFHVLPFFLASIRPFCNRISAGTRFAFRLLRYVRWNIQDNRIAALLFSFLSLCAGGAFDETAGQVRKEREYESARIQ